MEAQHFVVEVDLGAVLPLCFQYLEVVHYEIPSSGHHEADWLVKVAV